MSDPDPGDLMAVVGRYQSPLLRYAGHTLGRIDDRAEDVVQETFIRLHRQVTDQGAASIKHLTTWLYRVAHNLCMDALRDEARRAKATDTSSQVLDQAEQHPADDLDTLGEVLRQEAKQVALRELAELDEHLRQVVLLKVIQGMTLREIAKVAGVSLSAVNYRLNQALAELARRLRKAGVV